MSAFHRPKLFGGLAEQNGNGALAWWAERQKPSMDCNISMIRDMRGIRETVRNAPIVTPARAEGCAGDVSLVGVLGGRSVVRSGADAGRRSVSQQGSGAAGAQPAASRQQTESGTANG